MALSTIGRAIFFLFLIERNERMSAKKVTAKKKIASSKSATKQLHTPPWAKWLVPIILVLFVIGILLSVIPFETKTITGPQFQKKELYSLSIRLVSRQQKLILKLQMMTLRASKG